MKTFLRLIVLAAGLWTALPLCGDVLLPANTPVFAAPAHNQKIVAVAQQPVMVESLPEIMSIISKHPLARYFYFTPVRLPDGRTGFADLSAQLQTSSSGRSTMVITPYRPFWRGMLAALAAAGIVLLGYDWYRKKQGQWYHYAGLPALLRILLLTLLIHQAGNMIATPVDEFGYYSNMESFLKKDFTQPWHFTVGLSILYIPFAWLCSARNVGDIVLPFSYFSGMVLAPGMLIIGYFIGRKLTGSSLKSFLAMTLWAVWPFFHHHFAGFGIRQFWSYLALPSVNYDFAHYVNLIGASYNAMSDTPSTFFVLAVMAAVLFIRKWSYAALTAGVLYGFSCMIRINNILFVPALFAMIFFYHREWLKNWRFWLVGGGAFVLGFLPQIWANSFFFGNPFRFSYTNYAGGAHTYLHWIFFRTTAAYYGAANHWCWILAAAGLWVMRDNRLRLLLTLWAVPVICFFTLYSHGTDDAIRFILTAYPALFLAVTSCGIWEKLSRRGWVMAAVFLTLLACIPCNVTHAGKGIWYLYRNPIPAAGLWIAGQNRTVIFYGMIAILHLFGNGWILTGLLAGALVLSVIQSLLPLCRRGAGGRCR